MKRYDIGKSKVGAGGGRGKAWAGLQQRRGKVSLAPTQRDKKQTDDIVSTA